MEGIDTEADEMDCDTCLIMQEILSNEIDDPEFLAFAIENLSELLSYIESGRVNISIHRNIEGLPDGLFASPTFIRLYHNPKNGHFVILNLFQNLMITIT